jgi:hypothetical protein
MTNRTEHEMETLLRSSLAERSQDVEVTPALYERVKRQASRGAWLRRGVALVGVAAVAVAGFVIIPPLLPDSPLEPDIADTPDAAPTEDATAAPTEEATAAPTEGASEGATPDPAVPAPEVPAALAQANVAFADDSGTVTVAGRTLTSPAPVVSLAVSPFWTETAGYVAAGLDDGRIGIIDQSASAGASFDVLVDAAANGGGVAFSPDGDAVAWIEGTDLHILPLASELDGERVLPLEGDVPTDLRMEQWFGAADAQLVLASDPAGGVWRIPMDDSNAYNSAPTEPASLLPAAADADAVDAALLSDLSVAVLRVPADGSVPTLMLDGLPVTLDDISAASTELAVTGASLTVLDPTTGVGSRRDADVDSVALVASWEVPGVTAVAPLPGSAAADSTGASSPSDASALGLWTDAPVVGTAGTDLVVRGADGTVQTIAVYPPESEATLGRVAIRPGSTLDEGLVAVESFSEGENSVRFVALRDSAATPVGDVLVTDGPVTGLVWSDDGRQIAWTDTTGLYAATVLGDGDVDGDGDQLSTDARPVLDWVWTDGLDEITRGYLAVAVDGGTGVELLGIERGAPGVLGLTGPAGGSDLLQFDTHANSGAAVGPTVIAELAGGGAALRWSADGDQSGDLADPGIVGGDVRVQVSGGHVLVLGMQRQVLVTFDGEVVDLPAAADWDVLD